jgi:hypothetical protein
VPQMRTQASALDHRPAGAAQVAAGADDGLRGLRRRRKGRGPARGRVNSIAGDHSTRYKAQTARQDNMDSEGEEIARELPGQSARSLLQRVS